MEKAIGLGVPAGELKPCSGTVFVLTCANGFVWGMKFGNREAAQRKKDFFDWRKADLLKLDPETDVTCYNVTISKVPSTAPDAIQTPWGEMVWTREFSEDGEKLYKFASAKSADRYSAAINGKEKRR
jgi:hypothetical protein